jgi:hypothetical protein
MSTVIALAPFFAKGVAVIVAAVVLFVGSVYLLLVALFGLRMGYLVLAVAFFGWMIIFSTIWVLGSPGSTPKNQGPRGTEPHWQVFAAGSGEVTSTQFSKVATYPGKGWVKPDSETQSSVDSVTAVMQVYLLSQFAQEAAKTTKDVTFDLKTNTVNVGDKPLVVTTDFSVQDFRFSRQGDTHLVGAHAFFNGGGPEITIFAYHDRGNVPIYSFVFLGLSLLGFAVHLPFLDRAEKSRKEILTGGTAPPWYGPA